MTKQKQLVTILNDLEGSVIYFDKFLKFQPLCHKAGSCCWVNIWVGWLFAQRDRACPEHTCTFFFSFCLLVLQFHSKSFQLNFVFFGLNWALAAGRPSNGFVGHIYSLGGYYWEVLSTSHIAPQLEYKKKYYSRGPKMVSTINKRSSRGPTQSLRLKECYSRRAQTYLYN